MAPRLQECYIKVQTFNPYPTDECGALVLHLRPRPQAAGLEIAVCTGEARWCCDGASRLTLDEGCEVHTVPAAADALAAFAASVIETGPPHWLGEEGEVSAWGVRLPSQPPGSGDEVAGWGWSQASVELHAAEDVGEHEVTLSGQGIVFRRSEGLEFQMRPRVSDTPMCRHVRNASVDTPPDPPDNFGQRWREARDRAAADLAAALTEVLQRAVAITPCPTPACPVVW